MLQRLHIGHGLRRSSLLEPEDHLALAIAALPNYRCDNGEERLRFTGSNATLALCETWKKRPMSSRFGIREYRLRTSIRWLSHHSKIMLGVLIPILCLDDIAVQRGITREG